MCKVIFLDIDGPMISERACLLPKTRKNRLFDPVAVAMVNTMIAVSGAKLVLSSSWGNKYSKSAMTKLLKRNGFIAVDWHKDWITEKKFTSERFHEISWWIADHEDELTHWLTIDDANIPTQKINWHGCSSVSEYLHPIGQDRYNGLSWQDFIDGVGYLGHTMTDVLVYRSSMGEANS